MSALGTKRTFRPLSRMSAFGGKADITITNGPSGRWLDQHSRGQCSFVKVLLIRKSPAFLRF